MSGARYDDRRNEAAAIPIFDVAHRLGIEGLRVAGRERVGPCPVCGGGARADRFSINQDLGVFNCRKCGAGGDGIAHAQFVLGCGFGPALDHLVGARDHAPDPEARARARRRA
ncbi:MAG: hypothetical protein HRU30_20720, partial [Rhodobacteraceae bacterium]|nr:hypothetical protein [Paracoccaceae bacterium]